MTKPKKPYSDTEPPPRVPTLKSSLHEENLPYRASAKKVFAEYYAPRTTRDSANPPLNESGWQLLAMHDHAGSRGLWFRESKGSLELCAGRCGDDAYLQIDGSNSSATLRLALLELLRYARFPLDCLENYLEDDTYQVGKHTREWLELENHLRWEDESK